MTKKNVMRMIAMVLVLTLISTTAICGTFAKYITSDSAKDTARVAKFGVLTSIEGNLFGSSYTKTSNKIQNWGINNESVSSVVASNEVVAPGTKGDVMSFSVQGKPEVSTTVTFDSALTETGTGISAKFYDSDIVLAGGDYGVMVKWTGTITNESVIGKYTEASGVYTKVTSAPNPLPAEVYELKDAASVGADYYPLDWYVSVNDTVATSFAQNAEPTSGDITRYTSVGAAKNSLKSAFAGKNFKPNEDNHLAGSITWDWDFEESAQLATNSIYYTNDKADTILGDMIAASLAGTGETPIAVVVKTGDTYTTLQYDTKPVGAADSTSSAVIAFVGTAPEVVPASTASGTVLDGLYAVLTVNFNASVTVTQVD